VVVSDLGTVAGVPGAGAVVIANEIGSTTAHRLLLTSPGSGVHVALVVDGTGMIPTAVQLAAATRELITWRTTLLP
jgi:hypothetical protein